jgi:hypothetical protein
MSATHCIVDGIILSNARGGHGVVGMCYWCSSRKLPMKILFSGSSHEHDADREHSVFMHDFPKFPSKMWLVEHEWLTTPGLMYSIIIDV